MIANHFNIVPAGEAVGKTDMAASIAGSRFSDEATIELASRSYGQMSKQERETFFKYSGHVPGDDSSVRRVYPELIEQFCAATTPKACAEARQSNYSHAYNPFQGHGAWPELLLY